MCGCEKDQEDAFKKNHLKGKIIKMPNSERKIPNGKSLNKWQI